MSLTNIHFKLVLFLVVEAPGFVILNRSSSLTMSSACPSSRVGHVAAVIDDEMLLWGGVALREASGETYFCSPDLIESFNLLTNQWTQRRATSRNAFNRPLPCQYPAIGVVQNRNIYQFGGIYFSPSSRNPVFRQDLYKLALSTLEWLRIIPNGLSTPTARMESGLCVLGTEGDEHLVLMGGLGPTSPSATPEGSQFDPIPHDPSRGYNNEVWLFSLQKSE